MAEARRRVEFTRSGGIVAANTLQTAVDLDEGTDDQAAELAELLDQVDLTELAGRSPLRGPGADTYQYELTVDQGDRRAARDRRRHRSPLRAAPGDQAPGGAGDG